MRVFLYAVALSGAQIFWSAFAIAVTVTTADGTGADAWVQENATSSTNKGNTLGTRTVPTTPARHDIIFVRFDLTGIDLLTEDVVTAALEFVWATGSNDQMGGLSGYGLGDGVAGETSWNEATLSYSTAPGVFPDSPDGNLSNADTETANGESALQIYDLISPDGSTSEVTLLDANIVGAPGEGAIESFSSSLLVDFLIADTNGVVTFLVVREINNTFKQAEFESKETASVASQFPKLLITLPEPGTLALVAWTLFLPTFRLRKKYVPFN